ncbi:methyl-accepting chemotaxis protein [Marinibaculum pumilum]|uniref:Methyl-accepting chemotaxis protein n=1 Tax=Marinibaculum pumilum TaxID=1766165 RepID=A0ABV7KZ83_9PROT
MSSQGGIRNLKIRTKIALAFAVMVVVALAAGGITFWSGAQIGSAVTAKDEAFAKQERALNIVLLMRGQEGAIRGLLNTGDRDFIDDLEEHRGALTALLAEAVQASADEVQRQRLQEISTLADRWYNEFAAQQVRLMGHPDTVTQARAIEFSGAPAMLLLQIAALIDEVRAAEAMQIEAAKETQDTAFEIMDIAMAVAALLSIFFAALFGMLLVRAVARPVVQMTDVMTELAGGQLQGEIPATGRGDEIGAMARAVEVFKENAIERERLAAQEAEALQAREARARRMEELTGNFDEQVRSSLEVVAAAATELQATAETLLSTANLSQDQAAAVSAASDEAAASVQTVAAATQELSHSIEEINRQMAQSTDATNRAVQTAEHTSETVRRLSDGARKIGDVVTLISEIAEQTNLLALNATIEAARAGDAGKGFAVVASEVKQLASQTAKATEEISQQVGAIQGDTKGAVDAIEAIRNVISEVNEIATAIASAMTEQRAATEEISRNIQQAADGSREVSSNIVGVRDGADRTLEAAGNVKTAAGDLSSNSESLRADVVRFLTDVRAA